MNLALSKLALGALVLGSVTACAEAPVYTEAPVYVGGEPIQDVSPYRHGNLAAAQGFVRQAYDRVSDAQQANNDQLGGHAARAKEILRQANEELSMAAAVANSR